MSYVRQAQQISSWGPAKPSPRSRRRSLAPERIGGERLRRREGPIPFMGPSIVRLPDVAPPFLCSFNTVVLEPSLVELDGKRPDEPQAALAAGKDAGEDSDDVGAPSDILVEAFQMLVDVIAAWQCVGR